MNDKLIHGRCIACGGMIMVSDRDRCWNPACIVAGHIQPVEPASEASADANAVTDANAQTDDSDLPTLTGRELVAMLALGQVKIGDRVKVQIAPPREPVEGTIKPEPLRLEAVTRGVGIKATNKDVVLFFNRGLTDIELRTIQRFVDTMFVAGVNNANGTQTDAQ